MIKKILLVGLLLMFLISFTSAKAICGQVDDSNVDFSASWLNVRAFYLGGPETFCEVSPEENKYCCDLDVLNENWEEGDLVFAEIYLPNYFAGPTSVEVSNSPYDIFPNMSLKKAINVISPSKKFFLNASSIFFNLSFAEPFEKVYILENGNERALCEDCGNYYWNETISYGTTFIQIRAVKGEHTFYKNITLHNLENFDVHRSFSCEGCRGKKIKANKVVNVSINVSLNPSVSGMKIEEFVPSDFEILGGQGLNYNLEFNSLSWNVTGDSFEGEYSLMSPNVRGFPKIYSFMMKFEEEVINQQKVLVFKRIPFHFRFLFRYADPEDINSTFFEKFHFVSPSEPFVYPDDGMLELAIFPLVEKETWFSIAKYDFGRVRGLRKKFVLSSYSIQYGLNNRELDHIFLDFKISENELRKMHFLRFYGFYGGKWRRISPESYSFDEGFVHFRFNSGPLKGFIVYGR